MEQKFKVIIYLGNQVQGLVLTLIHEPMASLGNNYDVLVVLKVHDMWIWFPAPNLGYICFTGFHGFEK